MLTDRLRIVLAVVLLLYFCILVNLLRKKKLELKYSLLWIATGVVLVILDAFPRLLNSLCDIVGVASAVNGLFMALLGLSFCLIMSLTSIVSKQKSDIKKLIQNESLLESRIRELEQEKSKKV